VKAARRPKRKSSKAKIAVTAARRAAGRQGKKPAPPLVRQGPGLMDDARADTAADDERAWMDF
jgi:hypothetical protein